MAFLQCEMYPGQFSSEFAVVVQSSSGRQFSLFADKNDLQYMDEPTKDRHVPGWISVEVMECEKGLCLVRLPQTTLENGQFVTVVKSSLRDVLDEVGVINT